MEDWQPPLPGEIRAGVAVFAREVCARARVMTKKIDIMGIKLDNYSVREAISQMESSIGSTPIYTIEDISVKMLLRAGEDAEVREAISSLSLTVIRDRDVLRAAGEPAQERYDEANMDFAEEFFKILERNRRSVFLLGETAELVEGVKGAMEERFPRIPFAGAFATEECVGDLEMVINEMNAASPDVVVSVLPTPQQEHFLMDHKDKMSVNVWYGMGEEGADRHGGILRFFKRQWDRGRLQECIRQYRITEEGSREQN